MKLKSQNELEHLIEIFLNVTNNPYLEPIYLLDNKYYLLQSTNGYKSRIAKVRLVETDIQGNCKNEDGVTLIKNAEDFKSGAKIVGGKEFD